MKKQIKNIMCVCSNLKNKHEIGSRGCHFEESEIVKPEEIERLIRILKKDFGKKCSDENWDCPACRAWHLIAGLEWYLDLLDN